MIVGMSSSRRISAERLKSQVVRASHGMEIPQKRLKAELAMA